MGSFQYKIKNFERHYGVHLRSLRRSRRFMTLFLFIIFLILIIIYKIVPKSKRTGIYSVELENCVVSKLDKFRHDIDLMNTVVSEWPEHLISNLETLTNKNINDYDLNSNNEENNNFGGEKLFLPFTGNGYIGILLNSNNGLYASYQKSLSLPLRFNPLPQIYSDSLKKKELTLVEFLPGIVHKIQCFQNNKDCVTIMSSLYAHRTRSSVLVQELTFNNPTKESVTFEIIQTGINGWNQSKSSEDNINGIEFNIHRGVIDILVDNKQKHLCVSIATTKMAQNIRLKEHDFNSKHYVLTVVKYSTALLTGKLENLEPILNDLEIQVKNELSEIIPIGFVKLKSEHSNAWKNTWKSGFHISNSLASGVLNGDQINASIYYVLTNNRAPLVELTKLPTNSSNSLEKNLKFQAERCYEGFSTLHATKLWKLPKNEADIATLNYLWTLTLQKHGCRSLLEIGVEGYLQAIILSLGGFKFTHHHLDLNLNPRQLHRNYGFRQINYANLSFITVEIEVGEDNHALIYVTLNELIDDSQKFYACDGGCLDTPIELSINSREQFPVKMTNPPTAILYISSDKAHIDELKHALHVQEVDIAPAQDVNAVAVHRHGHHFAGLSTLFWALFVLLIFIFHLFLFKLIYREMCSNNNNDDNSYSSKSYESSRKYRFTRTV